MNEMTKKMVGEVCDREKSEEEKRNLFFIDTISVVFYIDYEDEEEYPLRFIPIVDKRVLENNDIDIEDNNITIKEYGKIDTLSTYNINEGEYFYIGERKERLLIETDYQKQQLTFCIGYNETPFNTFYSLERVEIDGELHRKVRMDSYEEDDEDSVEWYSYCKKENGEIKVIEDYMKS